MSKYYPGDALKLIRKYLDTDDSYIVQAEMIRQLGSVGDQSDIEKIEFYKNQRSPRKILRNASVKALTTLKGN